MTSDIGETLSFGSTFCSALLNITERDGRKERNFEYNVLKVFS